MRILRFLAIMTTGFVISPTIFAQSSSNKPPTSTLVQRKYLELPLGAIQPKGWLKQQLLTMKNGATGHLDEYYPKIKNDNGWLGGKGDSWEETPYWLDGVMPLAYLLDDTFLKNKVQRYVEWCLKTQRPNGFFGPYTKNELAKGKMEACADGEDWWPRMVMLKVLQQYYSATHDERVIRLMTNYFRYQWDTIKTCPLGKWTEWATARGGDNIMSVYWLYNQTGDKFLLELADVLYKQTTNWTILMAKRDWAIQAATNQTSEKWMERHAVNVAMGLKLPVEYYQAKNDTTYLASLKTGLNDLLTLHGLPNGMFSGDEDLHGNDPTQGVELCAIVEAMFSLEEAIGITGDLTYMDALERMAYNSLPTQTTDDYMSRQYFQIANQVQVSRGVFDFSLPFERGMTNVFGHYAGYTCCTANMHQGWTKFATHLWYATPQNGLAALEYAPSTVTAKVAEGTLVTIDEATHYPFEDQVTFTISTPKNVTFPLQLRIPQWCKEAKVLINGQVYQTSQGGTLLTIDRQWKNGDVVSLQLPMVVTTSNWAKNSRAIERGPLVYALKIESEVTKKEDPNEGTYYEYFPKSAWNYGVGLDLVKNPALHTTVMVKPVSTEGVWSEKNAPIEITTIGRQIPSWKAIEGVAHQPVTTRDGFYKGEVSPTKETIKLIPYGCTKLRIVAFPVVR